MNSCEDIPTHSYPIPRLFTTGSYHPQPKNRPFDSSKQECINWLDSLSLKITREEEAVVKWLRSYQAQLFEQFEQESQRLRQQLMTLLDEAIAENKKLLRQRYIEFGAEELRRIEDGRFRLTLLKCRVGQLRSGVSSKHYKRSIIEILSTDLPMELDSAVESIREALTGYQEQVFLKVNMSVLDRFRKEAAGLFFVDSPSKPNEEPSRNDPKRVTFGQFNLPQRRASVGQTLPFINSVSKIEHRPVSVVSLTPKRVPGQAPLSGFYQSPSQRTGFHRNRDAIQSGSLSSQN